MRLKVWPTIILCAVVNSLSFGVFTSTVRAQNASNSAAKSDSPAPSDAGWHVDVIPYIWFSGVNGTAGVLGHEASVHASFSDDTHLQPKVGNLRPVVQVSAGAAGRLMQ